MKVNVETLSPIERKLSIEVEPALIVTELDRAYSALNRQVKVPGFRPGKIPRRILEQRFKEQVEDDVIQRVVEKSYLDAIKKHDIPAVSSPQVTNHGIKPNEPFTFEARVQVKPVLEPKDYEGLKLAKTEVKVDDAAVAEQLERLRQANSRLEPVTDRDTAQAGDFAQIDYDASLEGKEFPGGKAENITVEVSPGELIRGNVEAVAGMKIGDTKTVPYKFPDDFPDELSKGKTAEFKITLKGLKAKVLPELNDEFAKEVQGGNSIDELKARIRKDLERSQKNKADIDARDQLIKALLEKNKFDVPRAMVDRAIDFMLRGALRGMMERGVDPRMLNLDFDKLREDMREKAEVEVRGTLLFEAIADKEKLNVSDEDVEKKLEQMAEEDQVALSQVKKRFKSEDDKEGLKLRLREEKTIEFLKSRASY